MIYRMVNDVAFHPNGTCIAAAGTDNTVKVNLYIVYVYITTFLAILRFSIHFYNIASLNKISIIELDMGHQN